MTWKGVCDLLKGCLWSGFLLSLVWTADKEFSVLFGIKKSELALQRLADNKDGCAVCCKCLRLQSLDVDLKHTPNPDGDKC